MVKHTGPRQEFGGDWTQQKLAILREYLSAYTKILRKQHFNFAYIDAFAGTGYRTHNEPKPSDNLNLLDQLIDQENQHFLEGSAAMALSVVPPFPTLIFIEKYPAKLAELRQIVNDKHADRNVMFKEGDANLALRELCKPDWHKHRAVLFLDPFGMQIEWPTIEAIAATKGIDLWLLFPMGVAVNRMLVRDGKIPEQWRKQLDKLFGTADWYNAFYAPARTPQLFGDDAGLEKTATFESIVEYFLKRLRTIFAGVATTPALLKNSKGNPLYALFFAAGNPKGAVPAVKIANDILRKFNHG